MTVKSRIVENPPMIDFENLPLLLDEKSAADLLGVSVSFLRKSRCDGEKDPEKIHVNTDCERENPAPPFARLNRQTVRYPKEDLRRWVKELKRRAVI